MAEDDLLDDSPIAFAKRLHDALEQRGYTAKEEKVRFVVETTGRTEPTVENWLAGRKKPKRGKDVQALAGSLQIRYVWLMVGGHNLNTELVCAAMRKMSDWEKNKFNRFLIRLLNNDPKAIRLAGMVERGQMSRSQLFGMM